MNLLFSAQAMRDSFLWFFGMECAVTYIIAVLENKKALLLFALAFTRVHLKLYVT